MAGASEPGGAGRALVFISGASAGLGLALARSVPFAARVVDISRRGAPGLEHVRADLAEPGDWARVAAAFGSAIPPRRSGRVTFIHCAGTLDPIGYAGEVDPEAYRRAVLLDAAAPLALGEAFLHAARESRAQCDLVLITSGAASKVYEGWSAYCAGKAAVDHWVRTVGAEQQTRGGGCRVVAVRPGVVDTAMQERIRAAPERDFPQRERFARLHAEGGLLAPDAVAQRLWALLEGDLRSGAVLDLDAL